MPTVNGVEYDQVIGSPEEKARYENMCKVGQLVKGYHAGYHVITRIEYRADYADFYYAMELDKTSQISRYVQVKKTRYTFMTPLVYYVRVFNDRYEKLKKPGRERSCDSAWVKVITKEYIDNLVGEIRTQTDRTIDNLENVVSLYVKE